MSTVLTGHTAAAPESSRPALEVADVFRAHGPAYRASHKLPLHHLKAMHAIETCRTAALGGHLEQCDACGHQRPVYNSCRNRHCPKCQALAKAQWLADRQAELLPVGYFHNVFTLPHELNVVLAANPSVLYTLLFDAAAAALQAFAADPQYGLGGQLGFTAVLHTWDQQLAYHVHLHCVIPGGALAFDGSRWLPAPGNYLFPVRALSAVFRRNYLTGLHEAFTAERLIFPGRLAALAHAEAFADFLQPVGDKDWVIYSQPPFAGPEKVLEYLSRYTHRVAISNHRLRRLEDGQVTFHYRDRKDGDRLKQRTLAADEFIRRFLTHVVPPRFCRIRHFGFLGNRVKQQRLERCRALLAPAPAAGAAPPATVATLLRQWYGVDVSQCPHCAQGRMVVVEQLPGPPQRGQHLLQHSDSS